MTQLLDSIKATLKEELGDYVSPGKLERVGRKLSEMLDGGSSRDHGYAPGIALDLDTQSRGPEMMMMSEQQAVRYQQAARYEDIPTHLLPYYSAGWSTYQTPPQEQLNAAPHSLPDAAERVSSRVVRLNLLERCIRIVKAAVR